MKKNSTKKALIASVLMLCLCFASLVGTTFAWFTDSVSSDGNVIKTGTLEVGFYWADGAKAVPADEKGWEDASKGAIFNNTLWEPGYTEAKHIKVANEGTLALNYKLAIIPHGEVSKLADVIDVYYFDGAQAVADRNDLGDAKYIGSLRTLINSGISEGTLAAAEIKDATIVLKMQESAGNEYQNLSIGSDFSIQLIATQVTKESDSFGNDYDAGAFTTVSTVDGLRAAIAEAVDTTTIFVQAGTYDVGTVITVEGKSINIVGLGVVNFNKTSTNHIFTVQDATDPASDMNVTIKNINLLGDGVTAKGNGFMVKYNVTLNLENVTVNGIAGADICIDNANPYGDVFYDGTKTVVNLKNTEVDDVSMDTLPVVSSHVYYDKAPKEYKTYAYLNYDEESSVQILEKQSISANYATMYVNGDNSDPIGTTFLVQGDEELASVLDAIHTNSKYWNTPLYVKLAAGEYNGDYVINQYPAWNGVSGSSGNNYAAGVVGAPVLDLTIVGETATTFARSAVKVPAVVFTGSVTINGFGNANTGHTTSDANPAPIVIKNVGFDASNIEADEKGDVVQVKILNAVDNLTFDGCYFANATHITTGGGNPHIADDLTFKNCNFVNGGCLSGHAKNLTVEGGIVDGADNGFINMQNAAKITVTGVEARVGKYFVRTNNSGIEITVTDGSIDLYESDGSAYLVYFRGSNESIEFTDVILPENYTTKGVDADSTVESYDFYDVDGVTYVENEITGVNTLYLVPSDYTGDTVKVAEGVDVIGNYAFAYNTNVKTVILPSSVRDLGRGFDSSTVEKVVLNEGLTVISSRAFRSTTALKEVVIPSTVTEIADSAFQKSAIAEIVIPASVKTIGETAFGASLIEKVTFEGDIDIQGYAFRGATKLRTVVMNGYDVNFVPSTLNGRNSCWFCNGESNNPNTSNITFYVKNEVIKERVLTAMGAERNNTPVICTDPAANENGIIEDSEGNTYAYANDSASLTAAVNGGADKVILNAGSYNMPSTSKEITITGNKDTVITINKETANKVSLKGVTVKASGNYTGIQHSNTVVFEDCTIVGVQFLYANNVVIRNCEINLAYDEYIWTYSAKNVLFENCVFNTSGKAILIYHEGADLVTNVTVKNCTFNASMNVGKAAIEIGSSAAVNGHYTLTTEGNTVSDNFIGEWKVKNSAKNNTTVNGVIVNYVADGLYKDAANNYSVYNGAGLKAYNDLMVAKTAGKANTLTLLADIDFEGLVWTTADSHVDGNCYVSKIDGNGYTVKNLTINGQAMFRRFAGAGDVEVKNITFDGANVNSNGTINTSILTVHTYQNILLDNVDVKNSTINGGYKVAPLIATVYNESSSTITATLKNCDVTNVTVKATVYDFCTTGLVAFVNAGNNDKIEFENCTVTDVTIIAPDDQYDAHAAVYTTGSTGLYNEVDGVTVTNVTFKTL